MKSFKHLTEEGYDRMRDRKLEKYGNQVIDPLAVAVVLQGLGALNPKQCLRKRTAVKTLPLTM